MLKNSKQPVLALFNDLHYFFTGMHFKSNCCLCEEDQEE